MPNSYYLPRLVAGLLLSFGFLGHNAAQAATYTVTTTVDNFDAPPTGSLREAVAAAAATAESDTITFNLPAAEQVDGKWQIAVQSSIPIQSNMTIVGPGSDKLLFKPATVQVTTALWCTGPITSNVTRSNSLSGFTVQGFNRALFAGYVRAQLQDVVFKDNVAAINGFDYDLTATNCRFENNGSTSANGGAIYSECRGFKINLTHCFFKNNKGNLGGAIYTESDALNLTHCSFESNAATRGGAVYMQRDMDFQEPTEPRKAAIKNCTIMGNTASEAGGALYLDIRNLSAESSLFEGNRAGTGGAISAGGLFSTAINACTFIRNEASTGGAASIYSNLILVSNCTFYRNNQQAGSIQGSALAIGNAAPTSSLPAPEAQFGNCTFADNGGAPTPWDPYAYMEIYGVATNIYVRNSLFKSFARGNVGGRQGNITSLGHNITIAPKLVSAYLGTATPHITDLLNRDPLLDEAGAVYNGGPVPTVAFQKYSPALNKGLDPRSAPFYLQYDGRGPGYPRVVGAQADIGAFERGPTPLAEAQTVTTPEDTPIEITLVASSPQNLPLTYKIIAEPTNGTLSSPDGNKVLYTPNPNYFGSDVFHFEGTDGLQRSASGKVSIQVTSVLDEPSVQIVSHNQHEDTDGKYFTNQPVAVYATVSDNDGYTELEFADVLVGDPTSETSGILVRCDFKNKNYYLRDDSGTGWVGPATWDAPWGSKGTLNNSQGQLLLDYSSVVEDRIQNKYDIKLVFIPTGSMAGNRQLTVRTQSLAVLTPWITPQNLLFTLSGNVPPYVGIVHHSQNSAIKPAYPLSQFVRFVYQFGDLNGGQDLHSYFWSVGPTSDLTKNFTIRYDVQTKLFYLMKEGGTGWIGGVPHNSTTILQNSLGKVDLRRARPSTAVNAITEMTGELDAAIFPAFAGSHRLWAQSRDLGGKVSRIQDRGPITFGTPTATLSSPPKSAKQF